MDHLAEQSVLGSLLIAAGRDDGETVAGILSTVQSRDFLDETDRHMYEAARSIYRDGTQPDAVSVLGRLGLDKDADARTYTAKLINETPTVANWREYAAIAHDEAVLAQIQAAAIRIVNAKTLDACREDVAALESAFHSGRRIRTKTLGELYKDFADRQQPDTAVKERYPIGLPSIDKKAKLSEGKLVCLGGLPSDGKTALALQWALNASAIAPTGVFSLETDDETVGDRLVTHSTGIDYDHITEEHLTNRDWAIFAEKAPLYANRPLRVFDESRLSVDQIAAISTVYGLKAVFIDYGQLLETDHERGSTRAEQLARVSVALKQFARSTNTLVVVLLQLKEPKTYKAPDGKVKNLSPTMEDIGESRQWSKDADVMLILSRPTDTTDNDYVEKLSYDKHRILKIAKNKEGKRGRVTLTFDGEHQTFYIKGSEPGEKAKKEKDKDAVGQQTFETLDESKEEGLPF